MAKQTQFEVLTLKNSEWQTDTHDSDRDEAIEEARNLYGQGHLEGVKVIGEIYDDQTGTSKEQTIFDTTKKVTIKPKSEDSSGVVPPREGRISSRKRPQPKKSSDFMVAGKAIFWLALILAGGLGILYGFDTLSALLNKLM